MVLFLIAAGGVARADAIDGSWCAQDGRRMKIAGPVIITPSGTTTEGDYRRHYFNYVIPDHDPDAGAEIAMRLMDENTVYLRRLPGPGPIEVWLRCGKEIS
jgi:hypothetical protein